MSPHFALAQSPASSASPQVVQIDTSQPGRVTLAYFSDSKTSLLGVTYSPWRTKGNFSIDLAYMHAGAGSEDQFLGTAGIYKTKIGHGPAAGASYVAFGLGVKGWKIGGVNSGSFNEKRDLVFGAGISINLATP